MLERVLPAVVNISTVTQIAAAHHPLLRDPFFRHFIPGERIDPALEGALMGEVRRRARHRATRYVAIGPLRPESPAWLSGLREGDLILGVNRVAVDSLRALKRASSQAGGLYSLRLLRDGQVLQLSRR